MTGVFHSLLFLLAQASPSLIVVRSIYDCTKREIETEILREQKESMENGIERLRQLPDLYKDTNLITRD